MYVSLLRAQESFPFPVSPCPQPSRALLLYLLFKKEKNF